MGINDVKMMRVSTLGNGLREMNNTWLYQQFDVALDYMSSTRNLRHYSPLFNKLYDTHLNLFRWVRNTLIICHLVLNTRNT